MLSVVGAAIGHGQQDALDFQFWVDLPPDLQTLRIGVALYQQEDTFIETVTRELQRVALEKEQAQNCKINLYITDGKESQTSQNEQVDRFLERGYDVI